MGDCAPYWKPGKGLFGLTVYRIFGYRCKKCSYVEFYAEGGVIYNTYLVIQGNY